MGEHVHSYLGSPTGLPDIAVSVFQFDATKPVIEQLASIQIQ